MRIALLRLTSIVSLVSGYCCYYPLPFVKNHRQYLRCQVLGGPVETETATTASSPTGSSNNYRCIIQDKATTTLESCNKTAIVVKKSILNEQRNSSSVTASLLEGSPTILESRAVAHFEATIRSIELPENSELFFSNSSLGNRHHRFINSLIFTMNGDDTSARNGSSYMLVIVPSDRRVNVTALQNVLGFRVDTSFIMTAPSSRLVELCGFAAGSIPPFGFLPSLTPNITILDASLLLDEEFTSTNKNRTILVAGGGIANRTLLTSVQTIRSKVLQSTSRLLIGFVSTMAHSDKTPDVNQAVALSRPVFPIEPPPSLAYDVNKTKVENTTIHRHGSNIDHVVVVGRIHSVRRMAKNLVFADLHPPLPPPAAAAENLEREADETARPWQAPMSGMAMAVQLIAGQTLEQNNPGASRLLGVNQLVSIHGFVSIKSKTSMRNWRDHQTLDIVVTAFSILQQQQQKEKSVANDMRLLQQQKMIDRRKQIVAQGMTMDQTEFLSITDLYNVSNADDCISIVNDMRSLKKFSNLLKILSQRGDTFMKESINCSLPLLVGIDCEWLPSSLLEDIEKTPQPVLLLQISLHPLQQVFLFDLKTMLRPLMLPTQRMNKLEKEVSFVLGILFESKKIIKVGFQIAQDLQLLAASYPHVDTFQFYNSILECSRLGKKAIQRHLRFGNTHSSQYNVIRAATSSLSRMVHYFIGKKLSKIEQCSDWSNRPLSADQIAYSALDSIVTPVMVETIVRGTYNNRTWWHDSSGSQTSFGKNDSFDLSLKTMVTSWRFLLVTRAMDIATQKKLRAKRIMVNSTVISQNWMTRDMPPQIPSCESIGKGRYRDSDGILRIPSNSVRLRTPSSTRSLVGQLTGHTKQKCLIQLLESPLPEETAELDFLEKAGYVAFSNGCALFVSMGLSYPNQWLDSGKTLTWYIRESEWQSNQLLFIHKNTDDHVVLFVRQGRKSPYLCCGRCRVSKRIPNDDRKRRKSWALVELHLELIDWEQLRNTSTMFSEVIYLNLNNV